MTPGAHEAFAACVGIDWADATHAVCLQTADSPKRDCFQLEHTPEAIDAWVTTLRTRCNGQPVAIGLARTKGPLVSAWRTYDFLVLFPSNPLIAGAVSRRVHAQPGHRRPHGRRPPARTAAHPARHAAASAAAEPHPARPRTARRAPAPCGR